MSYWSNKGTYQTDYDRLWEHIPSCGEVEDPDYMFLESLRMFSKLYYRFFNDGDYPGDDKDYNDYYYHVMNNRYLFEPFFGENLKPNWTEETLDLFMDAIVQYSLRKEQEMLAKKVEAEDIKVMRDETQMRDEQKKKTRVKIVKTVGKKKRKTKLKSLCFF